MPESVTGQEIGARLLEARRTHRRELLHLEGQHVRFDCIAGRSDEYVVRVDVGVGAEQERQDSDEQEQHGNSMRRR